MAPPLSDGAVEYDDGAPQIVSQYAKDVASFLHYCAEPELEQRRQMGACRHHSRSRRHRRSRHRRHCC